MRVGGDTNAIELEDENFTLKRNLVDVEQELARRQDELREMDSKYAKAMLNLVKLDQAWKGSVEDLRQSQSQIQELEGDLMSLKERLMAQRQIHEAETLEIKATVVEQEQQLSDLRAEFRAKAQKLSNLEEQSQLWALHEKELQGKLDALKKSNDGVRVASQHEHDELQREFQASIEQNAVLRGEVNALREEMAGLTTQVNEAKTSAAETTSRFLQLKQDHATLEVHLASAKQTTEHSKTEIAFLKTELERMQSDLSKREKTILALETSKHRLMMELGERKKLLDAADQTRDHEIKRLQMVKEKQWREREFDLEKQVNEARLETRTVQHEIDQLRTQHVELADLLVSGNVKVEGASNSTNDLKALVKEQMMRTSALSSALEKANRKIEQQERALGRVASVELENEKLKTEYENVKKTMERMVQRRLRSTDSQPSLGKPVMRASSISASESSKRKIGLDQATSTSATGRRLEDEQAHSQRIKRVYVPSRYMNGLNR